MIKHLLTCFILMSITSVIGQYCTSGGPTSNIDSNIESVSVIGESSSINYTGCPGIIGVESYNLETVTLQAGNNYSLSVQFGTCGGNYSGVGEVWIDFNSNQIFEAFESIGTWAGVPPTTISVFSINVPSGANTGLTKMRIMQAEGQSLPLNPCASFNWGSVTDFNIEISGGVDCTGYIGDDISSPRVVSTYPFVESYSTSTCYSNQNAVYSSPDVYYLVIPDPSMNSMEFSLCGSNFDTFMTILDEEENVVAINDDHPDCNTQSKISIYTSQHDSLYVIVEGWSGESGDYTLSIGEGSIGLDELNISESLTISPNPSSNWIQLNNEMVDHATITNNQGAVIIDQKIDPFAKIDITRIKNGIYFIHLKSSNLSQKLIKQ